MLSNVFEPFKVAQCLRSLAKCLSINVAQVGCTENSTRAIFIVNRNISLSLSICKTLNVSINNSVVLHKSINIHSLE